MTSRWPTKTLVELESSGVLELGRGKVISKKDLASCPGPYPVYSSAKENEGKFGQYGKFMFDEELITWSVDGGGRLFHRPKHKFSVTNVGGTLRILRPDILEYRFLFYCLTLLHSAVDFDWVRKAHPSVIRKIYNDILVPSLPEQKRVVAILDEAFARIDAAIANTEKNLANAREVFESYLNDVLTKKGEGWEEKTLKDISIDFGRGKSKHRPRNDPRLYGGEYPFIQTGDVRNSDHVIMTSTQNYNEFGLFQSKLWPKGTICITIAANIAETGILNFDACFPDSIIGIVVDPDKSSNDYVEYLLQSVKLE